MIGQISRMKQIKRAGSCGIKSWCTDRSAGGRKNESSRHPHIWGEVELAYENAKGDVLAITGTNGKTTTTSLLGEIMEHAGKRAFMSLETLEILIRQAAPKMTEESL